MRILFDKGIQGTSLNYEDTLPNAIIRADPRLDGSLTILLEGNMNELRTFLEIRKIIYALKYQATGKILRTFVSEIASYMEVIELC